MKRGAVTTVSERPVSENTTPSIPTKLSLSPQEREALVQEFLSVIKYMAMRMAMRASSGLNVEDLMSAGMVGLLDALTKFDPSREIKFRTYAEFRIRGAMLDEIRAMDWVPRSLRERIGKIQHAANEWTKRKGRPPTEEELAESLGMQPQEVDETLLQAKGAVVLSLDDLGSNDEDSHPILDALADRDQPSPLETLVSEDARQALVDAIERLPERQRLVLTLYYFEELTMKEIGVVLHVTESRICQLHAQAMIRLKALLHTRLGP
ncbi:FliA/WhiG family RNA polymerase sigma factor [uncultured Nitrospira sp.]|uniref:sigma-70 family RNA polymerase sigma factor n=1 Tax=uncultured Nitrospira sp. TaxID=157176 RepID=UPI0031408E45